MYVPKIFRQDDPAVLREIVRNYSFATVTTVHDGVPFASHLPILLDEAGGGTLWGHMARANPQWRDFQKDGEVLVVFQGPHTYVSPSWYAESTNVPTWNYVVVHAYGRPRVLSDEETLGTLRRLVAVNESGRSPEWNMDVLPTEFVEELLQAIVGFAITITRMEGKLKLSQNRQPEDAARVLTTLASSPHPHDQDVATWMKRFTRAGSST